MLVNMVEEVRCPLWYPDSRWSQLVYLSKQLAVCVVGFFATNFDTLRRYYVLIPMYGSGEETEKRGEKVEGGRCRMFM